MVDYFILNKFKNIVTRVLSLRLIITMEPKTEMEYIRQILNGDTGLFSYFVNGYSKSVYSIIVKIVKSPENAEELTQDVFLKVFNKLGSFKGECKFSTWIYRISYNTAISAIRKKKLEYPLLDESALNNVADSDVDYFMNNEDDEAVLKKLEQSINLLTPEEQTIITLHYQKELPVKELAEILDLTEANVKIKLYRSRKKLYFMIKN